MRRHRPIECLIRAVLLRCSKGLHCLSAAWHIRSVHGRLHVNNRFCSVGGHGRNLTTSYFEQKETKFVGNKTAIYSRNRSSLCLLFVKLALLCVFSSFIRPRESREHAFDVSGIAKLEPQQRRQWEGANVRQKNPSPQTLQSPKIRERLVVTLSSAAQSCRSMSSYGRALAASSRVLAARSESVYFYRSNRCWFRSKFAWTLPLSLSSPWTMNFFLRNDKYGQEVKIISKCPTSAMDSPHVKYVKGCLLKSQWTWITSVFQNLWAALVSRNPPIAC